MTKFLFTAMVCGVAVLCFVDAASATLVISDGSTATLTFDDNSQPGVFKVGKGTNAGGSNTGIGEPEQYNFFGTFNSDASGGLVTTGASISYQYHNGEAASPFGADSNGDSDFGDIASTTNRLGAEQAADLAGHSTNGLLVSVEADFARSSVYLRIQNNTGATVTDWTFAADVFYEETGGGASTATFGYAVDNGTIATAMTFTSFGTAPAAVSGDTYATSAYSLNETVTTAGVADGDYIVLGFFDQLNNANGSGIVIDDIGVTAVLAAVPEPSSFLLLGSISLLAMFKNRRVRS